MKTWQKAIIIFVGCGTQAVLSWATTLWPIWATVFGGASVAVIAAVGVITGWPPKAQIP